jgi:chitinase
VGIPANKLILGILYGRKWDNVSPENNGLYQSAETANDIISSENSRRNAVWKIQKLYDNQAKASHLWNAEDRVLSLMKSKEIKLKAELL